MREEANLLDGTSTMLERAEELERLRPSLARLVPRALGKLFTGFPGSFRELSAECAFPPLARWLSKQARSGRCELAIHRAGPPANRVHKEPEVYLHVGSARVMVSGPVARVPRRCPSALAAVLRASIRTPTFARCTRASWTPASSSDRSRCLRRTSSARRSRSPMRQTPHRCRRRQRDVD